MDKLDNILSKVLSSRDGLTLSNDTKIDVPKKAFISKSYITTLKSCGLC